MQHKFHKGCACWLLGFHKSNRIMGNEYFWGRTLGIGSIYTDSYLKLLKIKAKTYLQHSISAFIIIFEYWFISL